MKHTLFALTVSTAALLAGSALAAEGWYVGGHGGANYTHEDKATVSGAGVKQNYDHDWGWAVGGSIGYDYGNGFRNELETTYRSNELDEIGSANGRGETNSWAFMYNAAYGFDIFEGTGFIPYIGAGIGAVHTDVEARTFAGARRVNDGGWDLGVQGLAGWQYALADNVDVFGDYRYLTTFGTEYKDNAGDKVSTDYDNSTFVLGLRYSFGAPAPVAPAPVEIPSAAPAMAPAPAPVAAAPAPISRKYLVFFDFNRANLTPEAVEVIKQAAADAVNGNAVSLDISGHADRSGTDSYNQRLSAKRAAAVKAQLQRLGINPQAVGTSAYGENQPLVPTDDGVKEAQNRRAEITYVVQPR